MLPKVRTSLRRAVTILVGVAALVLAYVLHRFAGGALYALMILDALLVYIMLRLLFAESRDRDRR